MPASSHWEADAGLWPSLHADLKQQRPRSQAVPSLLICTGVLWYLSFNKI